LDIHAHTTPRRRPSESVSSKPARVHARALAIALIGILVLGSVAVLVAGVSLGSSAAAVGQRSTSPSPNTATRDALTWPFASNSIWNLPIGATALYVPANIKKPSAYGMTTDVDVLILTANAPNTPVYYNGDAWGGGSRCSAQGGVLFSAPIPTNFVVPGAGSGNPDGTTPNYSTAILMADGHTLVQGQPMARCTSGGTATMMWSQQNEDLLGTGNSGAHGGSMLSSLGGTIRIGELVPGGAIRHAMKVNLYGAEDYFYDSVTHGYRWPATTSDSGASGGYRGSTPALRMGSLLALPSSIDVNSLGLETEAAKIVAHAFQDYGGYTVDDAAWSVYALSTEYSPSGKVDTEFQSAWGFPISPAARDVPWARDMDRIFGALNVVDNWNYATWLVASVSNGALGAGLGAPRVPWAPDFGGSTSDTLPPISTAALSGSSGAGSWFTSSVGVTVSASDSQSGVAAIQVRTDGGAWQVYTSPVTVAGDGTHTVDYYATDVAGNIESTHTVNLKIDTVSPASQSQVAGTPAGGGYLSPVTVTLSATDATSGVQSVLYRIDGGAQWTYGSPFHVAANGTHLVEYSAVDQAGNAESLHTLSILLSGASGIHPLPVTVVSMGGTGGANGWYISNVAVTMSASSGSGAATSVVYRLDGGLWSLYVSPFTARDGRHTLDYQASDADGYAEALRSAAINVDSTPPTVVKAADVIAPDAPLSWTGSDSGSGIVRYEVSIDGGPFQPMGTSTSITQHWTLGAHVATVKAWDNAGNQGSTSIPFRVDSNAVPPGQTDPTGPTVSEPLSTAPPGSLYLVIGFILVSVGILFLNRQKMDQLQQMRPRSRRSVH